jgi:hypothetical protein
MTVYTKNDFFRPARAYTGVHSPAAYAAGIERRKAENARMGQVNRAHAAQGAWLDADPSRRDVISALEAKAARSTFAQSLLDGYRKYGTLTEKQEAAARRMMDPTPVAVSERPGAVQMTDTNGFAGMVAMFEKASTHLRYPTIVFDIPGSPKLRISRAGGNSNAPGALNVKLDGSREYMGRVHTNGTWVPGRDCTDTAVGAAVAAFARNPAGVAAEYGRRTGCCCFCSRKLTDERSVDAGYGPICSQHFGLPWGTTAS